MKSLVMKRHIEFNNVKNVVEKVSIVETDIDEMVYLPYFVELSTTCNSKECDHCVETVLYIKTSMYVYDIINDNISKGNMLESNIRCPVCRSEMYVDGISIEASWDDSED